jgi:hypothetical protein
MGYWDHTEWGMQGFPPERAHYGYALVSKSTYSEDPEEGTWEPADDGFYVTSKYGFASFGFNSSEVEQSYAYDGSAYHYDPTPTVRYETYDKGMARTSYSGVLDSSAQGSWDHSFWDQFYFTLGDNEGYDPFNYDDVYELPWMETLARAGSSALYRPLLSEGIHMTNIQSDLELENPMRGPLIKNWALPTSQIMKTNVDIQKALVTKLPHLSPYEINLYLNAARELYGALTNPKSWGDEFLKDMDRDSLREWFKNKWSKEGLDPNALDVVFDIMMKKVDAYRQTRLNQYLRTLIYRKNLGK